MFTDLLRFAFWLSVFETLVFIQLVVALTESTVVEKGMERKLRVVAEHENTSITYKCFPYLKHPAWLGDLLLVSPLEAYLVAFYWREWSGMTILSCMLIGFAVSVMLHTAYVRMGYYTPDFCQRFGKLIIGGYWHMFYMAQAFAVIFLAYFATKGMGKIELLVVSVLLGLHVLWAVMRPIQVLGLPIKTKWNIGTVLIAWTAIALAYVFHYFSF